MNITNRGSFVDENDDDRGGLGDCDDDVGGDGGEVHVVIGLISTNIYMTTHLKKLPCVPGIVAFIHKQIEPIIFFSSFSLCLKHKVGNLSKI